jgi:hypothetical protein
MSITPVEEIVAITEDARKWPSFPHGGVSLVTMGLEKQERIGADFIGSAHVWKAIEG